MFFFSNRFRVSESVSAIGTLVGCGLELVDAAGEPRATHQTRETKNRRHDPIEHPHVLPDDGPDRGLATRANDVHRIQTVFLGLRRLKRISVFLKLGIVFVVIIIVSVLVLIIIVLRRVISVVPICQIISTPHFVVVFHRSVAEKSGCTVFYICTDDAGVDPG